ncbi:MAG: SEC-C metal-binding domain-containing protein [Burkholderiales bacterium]
MALANATLTPPSSRNAACPCGSGRRFKDCHGSVASPGGRDDSVVRAMGAALEAQKAGRLVEAIAAYDRVIERDPDLFDAWHMRGVAYLQCLDFDAAERDIRQALVLAPGFAAARANLRLVINGRQVAADEVELCRRLLPRYAPLAVDPPVHPLDGVVAGDRVFVIDAADRADVADALDREAMARGALITRAAVSSGRTLDDGVASELVAQGAGAMVVYVGTGRPFGDWILRARPRALVMVVVGGDLLAFVDRLREASGQGARQVRIALASDAHLDIAPIAHARLPT